MIDRTTQTPSGASSRRSKGELTRTGYERAASYDSGWTRSTDLEELTESSNLIVVVPGGGRAGFYSDWLDGPAWERRALGLQ